jgi:hypothetical protein
VYSLGPADAALGEAVLGSRLRAHGYEFTGRRSLSAGPSGVLSDQRSPIGWLRSAGWLCRRWTACSVHPQSPPGDVPFNGQRPRRT